MVDRIMNTTEKSKRYNKDHFKDPEQTRWSIRSDKISAMLKKDFRSKVFGHLMQRRHPQLINKKLHYLRKRLMFRRKANSSDDIHDTPEYPSVYGCSNQYCDYCSAAGNANQCTTARKCSSLASFDTDDFQDYNTAPRAKVKKWSIENIQSKVPYFMEEDSLDVDLQNSDSLLVRFNVSGTPFLILHSTLKRDPYFFAKIVEDAMWIPSTKEYFFERDPLVFRYIHNYLRLGELHLPLSMCGPLLEKELDAWEIPLGLDIQRCCLGPVIDSMSKLESLQKFEKKLDPKPTPCIPWIKSERWQYFREIMWHILEDPFKLTLRNHHPFDDSGDEIRTHKDSVSTTLSSIQQDDKDLSYTETNIGLRTQSHQLECEMTRSLNEPPYMVDSTSKHRLVGKWLPWLRRGYLLYEILIVTSAVLLFVLSTVPNLQDNLNDDGGNRLSSLKIIHKNSTRSKLPSNPLVISDFFFSTVIAIDVILRMVCCPSLIHWLISAYTIIDFLSLIPFVVDLTTYGTIYFGTSKVSTSYRSALLNLNDNIGILKVFVVLRLFRVLRRHRNTRVLLYTIRTTFADVAVILVLISVSSLFFGSAIYFADKNFRDIPSGTWWALVTMSTVGYGDLVPKQTFGFLVSMICILIGTLLMSYNIPILVNHFMLYYDHADQLHQLKQLHRTAKTKVRLRRRLMKIFNRRCYRHDSQKPARVLAKDSVHSMTTTIRRVSVISPIDP